MMIFFRKHTIHTMTAAALLLAMLLSFTACGNGDGPNRSAGSDADNVSQGGKTGDDASTGHGAEPAAALTLADGEAKLVYAKDNYAVAAYHGPYKDIAASFCDANGEMIKAFVGYGHPSDGWTLIISREFPEGYDYSEIGVSVTDYDGEPNADGTYPSQDYIGMGLMTEEEKKAIGLDFLDGHCCLVGNGTTMHGSDYFGIFFGITWFDGYFFESFDKMDGFADHFSFFAGDGTPLEDYFDGYSTLEIVPLINMFDVILHQDEGPGNKEKNKSMCDELKACQPYLVYTGDDGTEQRFDLLTE